MGSTESRTAADPRPDPQPQPQPQQTIADLAQTIELLLEYQYSNSMVLPTPRNRTPVMHNSASSSAAPNPIGDRTLPGYRYPTLGPAQRYGPAVTAPNPIGDPTVRESPLGPAVTAPNPIGDPTVRGPTRGPAVTAKTASPMATDNKNVPPTVQMDKLSIKSRDINILLLGETGVGKSTFINSVANYLYFKKFKNAVKNELHVLIPATVTIHNPRTKEMIQVRVGSQDANETQETGSSATQDVKPYVFHLDQSGTTRIRLIDTPGMGDTRGIEQDDENCDRILDYLSRMKELHGICILLKPSNPRTTVFFEYCFKQILSRLEKSASHNLMFVFTNSRGSNYTGGETMPVMKKLIENIEKQQPNIHIPFTSDNIFCFDNEPFRLLVALKNGQEVEPDERQKFIESWYKSSAESLRMLSYVLGDNSKEPLKAHQLMNTVSVNEARKVINQISQPLADISQLILDNIRILDRHADKLAVENESLDELKAKLYIPVINLQVTKLTQPVTVCTAGKCAKYIQVGDVKKWHYKTRCHDPCYLTNVTKELVGDPALMQCAAMNGSKLCGKCGCDFSCHMHVYYMTQMVDDKIEDNAIKTSLVSKERAIQQCRLLIGQIKFRKTELEKEKEFITRTMAQFVHYLQQNAITPFNDSYKTYIKYLQERERSLGRHCDHQVIQNLSALLNRYDEVKKSFDLLITENGSTVTSKHIMDAIPALYRLKIHGKKIAELMKSQKSSRKTETDKIEYVAPFHIGTTDDKKAESDDGVKVKKSWQGHQSGGGAKVKKSFQGHQSDGEAKVKNNFAKANKKPSYKSDTEQNKTVKTKNKSFQPSNNAGTRGAFRHDDLPPPYPGHENNNNGHLPIFPNTARSTGSDIPENKNDNTKQGNMKVTVEIKQSQENCDVANASAPLQQQPNYPYPSQQPYPPPVSHYPGYAPQPLAYHGAPFYGPPHYPTPQYNPQYPGHPYNPTPPPPPNFYPHLNAYGPSPAGMGPPPGPAPGYQPQPQNYHHNTHYQKHNSQYNNQHAGVTGRPLFNNNRGRGGRGRGYPKQNYYKKYEKDNVKSKKVESSASSSSSD